MESSACLTLGQSLTFKNLGVALRSFEGRALRDLADSRLRRLNIKIKIGFNCLDGPLSHGGRLSPEPSLLRNEFE